MVSFPDLIQYTVSFPDPAEHAVPFPDPAKHAVPFPDLIQHIPDPTQHVTYISILNCMTDCGT